MEVSARDTTDQTTQIQTGRVTSNWSNHMGKTSRNAKHSEKMKRKHAAKANRRAAYAALAGTSKKSKRKNAIKARTGYKHAHIMADCGNPGCKRCYPHLHRRRAVAA